MNTLLHSNQANTNKEHLVDVFLQIESESCSKLIQHLINQHITFTLAYSSTVFPKSHVDTSLKINSTTSLSPLPERQEDTIIQEVYDKYITNGLANHPPLQEEIAAALNISVPTFKTRFKAVYGKTFYQVYMDKKMEYAAQLLKQGYRANKVSAMVGYGEKSVIKFNKMFQKHFGITPKRYQIARLKK